MNRADLGPAPPAEALDLPAFRLRRWSIMDMLGSLDEAILTFNGNACGYDSEITLLMACHPRTGAVLRCTVVYPDGRPPEKIETRWIPGLVADLARTKTLEVFGPRRERVSP